MHLSGARVIKKFLCRPAIFIAIIGLLCIGQAHAFDDPIKTAESYDGYSKATGLATEKYKIPDVGSFLDPAFAYATLRAYVSDAGTESMDLLIYYSGANGWKFYSTALDSDGNSLSVREIDRQVEYGTSINEQFAASLSRPYLEAHQKYGLNIRFNGKYGNLVVKLPADYVQVFLQHLERIEASVREKIESSKTSPIENQATKPQLGVNYLPMDSNFARLLGLDEAKGVMLVGVAPNGAAARAGLKIGDAILTLGGKPIANTTTSLSDAIAGIPKGSQVPIAIRRGEQDITVQVQF